MNVIHGEHITQFNKLLIPKVLDFWKSISKDSDVIKELINLLSSRRDISCIISITYIKNELDYIKVMEKFNILINKFSTTVDEIIFVAQSGRDYEGSIVNFYTHVLINYIPFIMIQTFNKYKIGISINSMQGVERRNKESKNCAQRFSNYKHNLCISTINWLFDVFYYGWCSSWLVMNKINLTYMNF